MHRLQMHNFYFTPCHRRYFFEFYFFVFALAIEVTKEKVSKKEETGNEMDVMVNKNICEDEDIFVVNF